MLPRRVRMELWVIKKIDPITWQEPHRRMQLRAIAITSFICVEIGNYRP